MELFTIALIKFWYIMLIVFILGRFIYYPNKGKREFLFTYLMLATIIAILCILISRIDFSIGFALGIFAVFSIIRYRTVPISPREMTYIFLAAGIAAKNALVPDDIDLFKVITSDASILLIAGVSEYFLFRDKLSTKLIIFDNLELIRPAKRQELTNDLELRFGITGIVGIKIGRIDTIKNSVRIQVDFKDPDDHNFSDTN